MPSIFITGATGFLGRSILDLISEANNLGGNYRVGALSRNPEQFLQQHPEYEKLDWLEFVKGDICSLTAACGSYDSFIHGAGVPTGGEDPLRWINQLVQGTENSLRLARTLGVRRYLFMSSGAVYGENQGSLAIREWASTAPISTDPKAVYGNAKRWAEHLVVQYGQSSEYATVIGRYFSILSPHVPLDGPYAAGNFIRDAISVTSEKIRVAGDGEAVRTFLDGRTMAAHTLSLLERGAEGEAYNIGGRHPISIKQLALEIRRVLSPHKMVEFGDSRTMTRNYYVPNTEKISLLGMSEQYSLEQSIIYAASRIK